jgi:hypothetical protein
VRAALLSFVLLAVTGCGADRQSHVTSGPAALHSLLDRTPPKLTVTHAARGQSDIAFWEVLSGPDADHLSRIAGHEWAGLETAIQLETPPPAVAVRALDAHGRLLGVSETVIT